MTKNINNALEKLKEKGLCNQRDVELFKDNANEISAKVSLLTKEEIERIKKDIGSEKLRELESILKEIR